MDDCVVKICTYKSADGKCMQPHEKHICPHYEPFVVYGEASAMKGDRLVVNLGDHGIAEITVKDHDKRWKLYCKPVKIIIEPASDEELLNFHGVE